MTTPIPDNLNNPKTPYIGLAPYLRADIAGIDMHPLCEESLEQARSDLLNPELWMNVSILLQCLGQRDLGLSMQAIALKQKRVFTLNAYEQPAKIRLLLLSTPGDISANTPLDCLLEKSDVDLIFYYVSEDDPLSTPIPEHDVLFIGIAESDENRHILTMLAQTLAQWPKPVINKPQYIPTTGRDTASRLLSGAPGLVIPPTINASRATLQQISAGHLHIADQFPECELPLIIRPVGSQAGRDLERIERLEQLATYLDKVHEPNFFISRFIDYSGKDGQFRKFRVVLIDGKPYASHMGVSSHWMIHYVNAGMYENASKREEEAAFMEHFEAFTQRHRAALDVIYQRTNLDYLCIDCAETQDGQLLIFEIDHTMVVHAMDPVDMFPYKQRHIQKAVDAFRNYLFRLTAK